MLPSLVTNAFERAQNIFCVMFDRGGHVRVVRGKRELHFDLAVIDLHVLEQSEGNDVAAEAGITDASQCIAHLFFRNGHC